jgi:hypothetical protein
MQSSTSDPALHYGERGPSGLGNEYEPTTESSSDGASEDELVVPVTVTREREREREREPVASGRQRRRRR